MSTPGAIIGKLHEDGKITAIHCYYGQLQECGHILHHYYGDPAKVDALLALGNISMLGQEIGDRHDFEQAQRDRLDHYNAPLRWTLAYVRDDQRNPAEYAPITYASIADVLGASAYNGDWTYIFDQNEIWQVYRPRTGKSGIQRNPQPLSIIAQLPHSHALPEAQSTTGANTEPASLENWEDGTHLYADANEPKPPTGDDDDQVVF